MAVADHLLYALETLDQESGEGSILADAYLSRGQSIEKASPRSTHSAPGFQVSEFFST